MSADFADEIKLNSYMRRMTVDELWTLLRFGGTEFFSVEFEKRTTTGNSSAGTLRKMLCRTGMQKYKLGVIADGVRDAEDFRHGILTVWSMDSYTAQLKRGIDKRTAAFNAWRRIDLITLQKCSLLDKFELPDEMVVTLPPDFVAPAHNLSNQYRLTHMPRTPLLVHPALA